MRSNVVGHLVLAVSHVIVSTYVRLIACFFLTLNLMRVTGPEAVLDVFLMRLRAVVRVTLKEIRNYNFFQQKNRLRFP